MKILKSLQAATLLAVSLTSVGRAATYTLYVTGPTSFRASAINGIANILTNPVASYNGGTSLSTSTYSTFTGTIGTDTWNIYASWIGSEAAVKATSQKTTPLPTLPYLTLAGNTQSAVVQATAPAVVTGGTVATSPALENDTPQVTLADEFEASTQFHGTQGGIQYAALAGTTLTGQPGPTIIAVQPYKIIGSKTDSAGNNYQPTSFSGSLSTTAGSTAATLTAAVTGLKDGAELSGNSSVPLDTTIQAISGTSVTLSLPATATASSVATTFDYAGLSNLTVQLAKKTFTSAGGTVAKLSQFTGSNADAGVLVYAFGRSHDAGTRSGFVLETGIDKPGTATTAIQQYYPLDPNGNVVGLPGATTTIASLELVPAEQVNGVSYSTGQSGYPSGGTLAKAFTATNTVPNALFVSYQGITDAKTALGGNAQELSYNGVYYSPTAVQQGLYTLWSYEHLFYQPSLNAKLKATANRLAAQIASSDGSVAGVLIDSNFHASRVPDTKDGAIVTR